MRALFHRAAVFHDDDAVGGSDGREAVGDHEDGPCTGKAREGFLDFCFAFGVEGGGGLVQQQDRRIAQDGAGERDALALAAGEVSAHLAGGRVIAAWHREDELMRVGGSGGRLDFGAAGVKAPKRDVAGDRVVKQRRVLRDERHVAAQALAGHVAHIETVDTDAAGRVVVEAHEQVEHSRFARA